MFTVTNNVPRPVVNGWETTPAERAELDYVDWAAVEEGNDSFTGFRYRGNLYDLSEFQPTSPHGLFKNWDGVQTSSAFDAVVIRWAGESGGWGEYESVVVAHLHW